MELFITVAKTIENCDNATMTSFLSYGVVLNI